MTKAKDKEGCPICECDVCCKEIPESSALTAEGKDYIAHFCGNQCYEKWHKLHDKKEKKE